MVNLQLSEGHESGTSTIDEREPKGSHNIIFESRDNPNIGFYLHNSVSGSNWIKSSRSAAITLPYILRDVDSGVTFEVEDDGRHVSATDRYGALLWYRDPFADAHLEPYRVERPRIVQITPFLDCQLKQRTSPQLKGHNIFLGFNSSQFGSLDVLTGDFFYEGRN